MTKTRKPKDLLRLRDGNLEIAIRRAPKGTDGTWTRGLEAWSLEEDGEYLAATLNVRGLKTSAFYSCPLHVALAMASLYLGGA